VETQLAVLAECTVEAAVQMRDSAGKEERNDFVDSDARIGLAVEGERFDSAVHTDLVADGERTGFAAHIGSVVVGEEEMTEPAVHIGSVVEEEATNDPTVHTDSAVETRKFDSVARTDLARHC